MRLRLFGVALFLLSSALLARADVLYTVTYSYSNVNLSVFGEGTGSTSGTATFTEPSIFMGDGPFVVNVSDMTSSIESGLGSLDRIRFFPSPTDCYAASCLDVGFALSPGGGLAFGFIPQFDSALTSPGFYESEDGDVSVSITDLAATPEPSSLALLSTGVLGFAGVLRKRFV